MPFFPPGTDLLRAASGDATEASVNNEYHLGHPDVVAVQNFVFSMFPERDTAHYLLKWVASHYGGHVVDELFHVLIGVGSNGKSKFCELVKKALGKYYTTVPASLMTQKRPDAQGATPAYEAFRNKRSVWMNEIEKGERLNGGLMKELTGGDEVFSRALFEQGSEFKPQAKFGMVTNHTPAVPADDEAIWRRMRAIPFTMRFVPNPDKNDPLQQKRDNSITDKIPQWVGAFQWLLLKHYYPLYKREGIIDEAQVPRP